MSGETEYSSLKELVLSHFDAHQRGEEGESKKRPPSRRGSTRSSRSSVNGHVVVVTVEARVALLKDQMSRLFLLDRAMSDMSLVPGDENETDALLDELVSAVLHCVDAAVMASAKDSSSTLQESFDHIMEMAACLSCHGDGSMEAVAQALVSRGIEFSNVLLEKVRSQACKLLGQCVRFLKQDSATGVQDHCLFSNYSCNTSDWRSECISQIETALAMRLCDKSQAVRLAAIQACAHMSHNTNISNGLSWNLAHDPSVANRVAAVESIGISPHTVDQVILRVADVKVKVRVKALELLSSNGAVKNLTQEQCAQLVRSGFSDRCDATFEAAKKMVCTSWMKSVKFNPVALLELVGPTLYESECEQIARSVLDVASNTDKNSSAILGDLSEPEIRAFRAGVTADSEYSIVRGGDGSNVLSSAQVLFVRVLCDRAGTQPAKKAEIVGKVVPDIPALCEILQMHLNLLVESIQGEDSEDFQDDMSFVCMQLLQLVKLSDTLQEEGSRRHFITAIKDILSSIDTPDELLDGAIRAMASAHNNERHFLQSVSEILSDLSDGGPDDVSSNDISASRHLRIVSILAVVLENTSSKMAENPILSSFSSYILSAIASTNALVREGGAICVGKYALLSNEELVTDEITPLLLKVAGNKEEKIEIRCQATLAFCDVALLFGNTTLLEHSKNDDNISFVTVISDMIDHAKPAVVALAAEVAAKLLFAGKLHDSTLLAQLLILFFEPGFPTTDTFYKEEVKEVGSLVRLQQLLTVFFPAYSIKSKQGRDALLGSVAPVLTIVNEKQSRKGVKAMPIAKIVDYVSSTVEMGRQHSESEQADSEGAGDFNKDPYAYKGRRIAKRFRGKVFFGTVTEYIEGSNQESGLWHVQYDDGDKEDYHETDLKKATKLYEEQRDSDEKKNCVSDAIDLSETAVEEATLEEDNERRVEQGPIENDTIEEESVEVSSSLLVSVAISNYLSKENATLSTSFLRALCKILGGMYIDTDSDDLTHVSILAKNMTELAMIVTDSTSLRALQKLNDLLGDVQSEEEDSESEAESLAEALEAITFHDDESGEKENDDSQVPEKVTGGRDSDRTRRHLTPAN